MQPPLVVLVHGTRMSAVQWDPYAQLLQGCEVATLDLPGHGARHDEDFTAERALAVIGAAVSSAEAGQPVVLVGHSLGGYLAMLYAARYPDDLAGLMLVGASAIPRGVGAAVYLGFARLLPLVGYHRMAAVANTVMRWLGVCGQAAQALPGGDSYAATEQAWGVVMGQCGPGLLTDVRAPIWLVNGAFDHLRLDARRYREACLDGRIVTVRRATHLLPLTHPQALSAVINEALAEVRGEPTRL